MIDGSTSTLQPIAEVATPTADPSAPPTDAALLALGGVFDSLRAQDATLLFPRAPARGRGGGRCARRSTRRRRPTSRARSRRSATRCRRSCAARRRRSTARGGGGRLEALRLQVGSLEARVAQLQADGAAMRQMLDALARRLRRRGDGRGRRVPAEPSPAAPNRSSVPPTSRARSSAFSAGARGAADGSAVSPRSPARRLPWRWQRGRLARAPKLGRQGTCRFGEAMLKSPASPLLLRRATVKEVEAAVKQLVASQKPRATG